MTCFTDGLCVLLKNCPSQSLRVSHPQIFFLITDLCKAPLGCFLRCTAGLRFYPKALLVKLFLCQIAYVHTCSKAYQALFDVSDLLNGLRKLGMPSCQEKCLALRSSDICQEFESIEIMC